MKKKSPKAVESGRGARPAGAGVGIKSATAAEYRAYVERWKAVNAFQAEEHKRLSPAERLRQFFALMEMARAMKWVTHTQAEVDEVRSRWKKLRKAYGV